MQIAVGSTNQTKVKAVERALDDVRFQGWELGSVIAGLEGGTAPEGGTARLLGRMASAHR